MSATAAERRAVTRERVVRHALIDRVFHWVSAVSVLVLLGTAFLPIMGIQFSWVTAHWVAGLVLIAAVLFHLVRAVFWQNLRSMWIGMADVRHFVAGLRWELRSTDEPPPKPGKYSLAQKLIHHLFALMVLVVSASGALMLLRIDTPWWRRNPYWLEESTWGLVYVLHGLAALFLVTLVMLHVYFAVRPAKLLYLRAMLRGWISREEYETHHDPERWQVTHER